MIPIETWGEIRRLFYVEHLTVNAIALLVGVHHETVKRAIGVERFITKMAAQRNLQLEKLHPLIVDTLERIPRMRATRLLAVLQDRGFEGSIHRLRRYLVNVRPQKSGQVFAKLSFVPGEQAQCDWASCGKILSRKLSLFVMVLSYSRRIYARFTFDQTFESFAREHTRAFIDFCGVPRVVLYDNLKSAVVERLGKAIHFSSHLLEVAGYYRFRIEAAAVRHPQSKGRVERAIGYLKTSFLPGREFSSLQEANFQIRDWLDKVANLRSWPQDRSRTVVETFTEEQAQLLPLPAQPLDIWTTKPIRVHRWPFVRFDCNEYEIPAELVGKQLTLQASDETVRILDSEKELVRHARNFLKGQAICLDANEKGDSLAATARRKHHLVARIPEVEKVCQLLVEINEPLRAHLAKLYDLLAQYGAFRVQEAIRQALSRKTPRAESIAQILTTKTPSPPVPIHLPDRAGVRDMVVKNHDLSGYDQLYFKSNNQKGIDDDEEQPRTT